MNLNLFRNYLNCLQKYSDFSGRASRLEFWSFILANFLVGMIIGLLIKNSSIHIVYSIIIFTPTLAVTVRRLHDAGHSGEIVAAIYLSAFLGLIFTFSKNETAVIVGSIFFIITVLLNIRLFFLLIQESINQNNLPKDTDIENISVPKEIVNNIKKIEKNRNFLNAITSLQKLNFNIEELSPQKVNTICRVLDVVGEIPLHLRCWSDDVELIIAIDSEGYFTTLHITSIPKENKKAIQLHEAILNKMASKYPLPVSFKFVNSKNNTNCYIFTNNAYECSAENLENCIKVFPLEVNTLMKNYFH